MDCDACSVHMVHQIIYFLLCCLICKYKHFSSIQAGNNKWKIVASNSTWKLIIQKHCLTMLTTFCITAPTLYPPYGDRRCWTATLQNGSLAPSNSKGTNMSWLVRCSVKTYKRAGMVGNGWSSLFWSWSTRKANFIHWYDTLTWSINDILYPAHKNKHV